MPRYEYKVVPAPRKPGKIRGVKGSDNKFAAALANVMNEYGAEGWEYQRTDTLPMDERKGFTGTTTSFQNMLVFRREIRDMQEEPIEQYLAIEKAAEPAPEPLPEPEPQPALTFRRDPVPEPQPDTEPAAQPAPPEQPAQPAAVPTFRSASIEPANAPKLSAASQAPEGNAPEIKFRPSDTAANR